MRCRSRLGASVPTFETQNEGENSTNKSATPDRQSVRPQCLMPMLKGRMTTKSYSKEHPNKHESNMNADNMGDKQHA